MSTDPWVVYDYEVSMFTEMLRVSTTAVECNKFPPLVQNAVVESMLLHLRILVDILLSRGSGDDDIKLTDLLPAFKSSLVAKLKNAYGDRKTVDSPCWQLNKRLADPTLIRSSRYNYSDLLNTLGLLVMPMLAEIATARKAYPQPKDVSSVSHS